MSEDIPTPQTETICETENYIAWLSIEPDGEKVFHLELNNITIHFFSEEWEEMLKLAALLVKTPI